MTETAGVLHPSWHRVVLKLSGGLFAGSEPLGISPDVVAQSRKKKKRKKKRMEKLK